MHQEILFRQDKLLDFIGQLLSSATSVSLVTYVIMLAAVFTVVFTTACNWTLFSANCTHSKPSYYVS